MERRHRKEFEHRRQDLVAAATDARACVDRHQYRGFAVGCACLGWSPERGYGIYRGCNYKGGVEAQRQCAEPIAIGNAILDRCALVVGLVVIAPNQPDRGTTVQWPTLPPCPSCRNALTHVTVIRGSTRLVTICATDGNVEDRSWQQMLNRHPLRAHRQ